MYGWWKATPWSALRPFCARPHVLSFRYKASYLVLRYKSSYLVLEIQVLESCPFKYKTLYLVLLIQDRISCLSDTIPYMLSFRYKASYPVLQIQILVSCPSDTSPHILSFWCKTSYVVLHSWPEVKTWRTRYKASYLFFQIKYWTSYLGIQILGKTSHRVILIKDRLSCLSHTRHRIIPFNTRPRVLSFKYQTLYHTIQIQDLVSCPSNTRPCIVPFKYKISYRVLQVCYCHWYVVTELRVVVRTWYQQADRSFDESMTTCLCVCARARARVCVCVCVCVSMCWEGKGSSCASFFEPRISGSVHSNTASWDDRGREFPGQLRVNSFPW